MQKRIMNALFVLVFVGLIVSPAIEAKDRYVFGVHPYKTPLELFKKFKPIIDNLSAKLGKPVDFQVGKSYEEAAANIGKGVYDFAYLGPTVYVDAQDKFGVVPLAQVANNNRPVFHGMIVVKKGSGIKSVKDLKGKKFAFGERHSTLNHVVPLWMLMEAGIRLTDLKEYRFVGSHDNVALNVARGAADAAGLQPDVVAQYESQGLEVIATSPDLPEHVFVASKTLEAKAVDTAQKALLAMDPSLFKGIKGTISNVQPFADKDFDILRKIMKQAGPELGK